MTVKASAAGTIAQKLMAFHLKSEALSGARTWFARVPTECNLSDYPSRGVPHGLLVDSCHVTTKTLEVFADVIAYLQNGDEVHVEGEASAFIPCVKTSELSAACFLVN
jgi:hypothetical protein